MSLHKLAAGLALGAFAAGSANGAITVYGNSEARNCYEAAVAERAGPSSIRSCTRALDNSATIGRNRVATYVNRGILHIQGGNFADGLADYERALDIDAREPEAYLNKGLALLRRDGSGQGLLPLFDAAIEYGTSEPAVAYYGRAVANELSGDVTAAYHDLRRAAELAPEWETPTRDLRRFQVRQ